MNVEDFFDLLFPGDKSLNVPTFRKCDDILILREFYKQIPSKLLLELETHKFVNTNPEELIKTLKKINSEFSIIIEKALFFYFSRKRVVEPLTGRTLPLSSSGLAYY